MDVYVRARQLIDNEDYEQAVALLRPLADGGDSEAQFLLGYLAHTNADVNWEESRTWLQSAARQNHPQAVFYLATTQYDADEKSIVWGEVLLNAEAVDAVHRAAELGSVDAQRVLGINYCTGEGSLSKNEAEGRRWYTRAAEQGDIQAQVETGLMSLLGEGGRHDLDTGLRWLERAASSDDSDPNAGYAARILADIYETGRHGAPIDVDRARTMRELAVQIDRMFEKKYGS